MNFTELRKALIKKDFSNMNDRQFEAVTTVNGPLLVLAGAGSGKTTVLVNRIANLVKYGNAYNSSIVPKYSEDDIIAAQKYLSGEIDELPPKVFSVDAPKPWQILAITFTNKAAGELRTRITAKLGEGGEDLWAGTFHSICGRFLRRFADRIGYTSHFTVYDTDDQRRLMKTIMKQNGVDEKFLSHRSALSAISSAKNELITPAEFEKTVGSDIRQKTISKLYHIYQKRLQEADAMDFDDMIGETVRLLRDNPDVLDFYGSRFRYIMVDEYQDTNHAQYVLVSLLASIHGNLCVVGDDDQSIYRFRGATIENILNFEEEFSGAKTIRLEQNYRSTGNILNAANAVIRHNLGRKGKELWTDKGDGERITVYTASDEKTEARYVADCILDSVRDGGKFSDNAILYRMNAQSASMENVFARSGISYKIIGGFRFFERKEIRDVLGYLNLINNNNDDVRLRRVINEPKRGIGETTVSHAADIAATLGMPLFEVFSHADEYAAISRAAKKLLDFTDRINELTELADEVSISELFEQMLDITGYRAALIAEGTEEAKDRLENVKEFASTIKQYEDENENPTLSEFLEEIALVSDIDSLDENDDRVIMMTIHSAKGLEFDNVYLIGMEDGIFPGNQSIYGGEAEIEEERRLAYVAITRARKKLTVTKSVCRLLFGSTTRNLPSRFLREIPEELCDVIEPYGSFSGGFSQRSAWNTDYSTGNNSGWAARSSWSAKGTANSENNPSWSSNPSWGKTNTETEKTSLSFGKHSTQKAASVSKGKYAVGQRVEHSTFGNGIIRAITPMASDMLLQIEFEGVGIKKLMAGYAKLKVL